MTKKLRKTSTGWKKGVRGGGGEWLGKWAIAKVGSAQTRHGVQKVKLSRKGECSDAFNWTDMRTAHIQNRKLTMSKVLQVDDETASKGKCLLLNLVYFLDLRNLNEKRGVCDWGS